MLILARTIKAPFARSAALWFLTTLGFLAAELLATAGTGGFFVKVTMDEIKYLGKDVYEMRMLVTNISDLPIAVSEYEPRFLIQNDGIGKWTELQHDRTTDPQTAAVKLLPGDRHMYTTHVAIPPTLKNLYKNNDNEVNVRMEAMTVLENSQSAVPVENSEESAYWLKLQSSSWILREGM